MLISILYLINCQIPDLVDGAPKTVKENVKKEEAEELKAKFTEAGATVELQ